MVSVILLAIILLGNFNLFSGGSFFADADHGIVYLFNSLNENSNGWRPDAGMGVNQFYADPGAAHVWSLYRWWNHLFADNILAFNLTILILMWAISTAMYCFLKKAVPRLGTIPLISLALLIPFGSLRYEFIFLRHHAMMMVAGPLISILLYDFLKKPKTTHYFQYAFILFLTLFLGSSISLLLVLLFSVLFFLVYFLFHKIHVNPGPSLNIWIRYFFLNSFSGICILTLGAWIFYSIFLESLSIQYVRDPDYNPQKILVSPTLSFLANRIFEYLQAGVFHPNSTLFGIQQVLESGGWSMVSPFFPVFLFILILFKPENFWEFAAKFIVIGLFLYQELVKWAPGVLFLIHSVFNLYPPVKIHPFIQIYQVLFLGLLISKYSLADSSKVLPGKNVTKVLALFLSMMYAALFLLTVGIHFAPERMETITANLFNSISPGINSETIKTMVPTLISENIRLFNETIKIPTLLFYGFSCIIFIWLFFQPITRVFGYKKGHLFALVLLLSNIFLSFANFPLNKEPLIWEKQELNGVQISSIFEPYDRYIRIGLPKCRDSSNYGKCISKKYFEGEFGSIRYEIGYRMGPLFQFSKIKSHTQKNVAELIQKFMEIEGFDPKGIIRELSFDPPITSSHLFDFAAVNYFLSMYPQNDSKNLKQVYKSKQFYLYKNKNAWPYYYLAERLESISNIEDLYNANRGIAYVSKKENISFPSKSPGQTKNIELTRFNFGDMEFQYESAEEEFLVIADAWHPNWKAYIDGNEINVIKTNGIFKGVLLPAGKHRIHLNFDNSSYLPGVWVSIIAWGLFGGGWVWVSKFRTQSGL